MDTFAFFLERTKTIDLCPLYILFPKVIKHLQCCNSVGTLIVPHGPSAAYWSMLVLNEFEFKPFVVDHFNFPNSTGIFVKGTSRKSIFGTNDFKSKVSAVRIDCRE